MTKKTTKKTSQTTKRKPGHKVAPKGVHIQKPTAEEQLQVHTTMKMSEQEARMIVLRSRDERIAALEADLADAHARIAAQQTAATVATAATVDIDAMVRDVLTQDHKRNAYGPPPVLVLQQRGGEMHATLCVASGGTVLPYRSAWNFGHTIAEAVIALVHNIDPRRDVTGMCDGLRALCGART